MEADLRHAETIIKQLGLENAKPLSNPSADEVKRRDDLGEASSQGITKKSRLEKNEIGKFTHRNRTNFLRHTMNNSRIYCVF